jgi:hypothetical protein
VKRERERRRRKRQMNRSETLPLSPSVDRGSHPWCTFHIIFHLNRSQTSFSQHGYALPRGGLYCASAFPPQTPPHRPRCLRSHHPTLTHFSLHINIKNTSPSKMTRDTHAPSPFCRMSFAAVKIEELRREGDVTMVASDATLLEAYQVPWSSSPAFNPNFNAGYCLYTDVGRKGYLFGSSIRFITTEEVFGIV